MKKITLTLLLIVLGIIPTVNAQLQNNNWYYGKQAGLTFNNNENNPTILTDNPYDFSAGSATVSDSSGNLLFYTDGYTVYDMDHAVMKNGDSINGSSATSSALIVPYPNSTTKYYVFTTEVLPGLGNGLSYSIIDMSRNSGLGEVLEKGVNLLQKSSQKMSVTRSVDGTFYWLLVFAPGEGSQYNDTFYAYKIDVFGINLISTSTFLFQGNSTFIQGQMKISPDQNNIALVRNVINTQQQAIAKSTNLNNIDNVYVFDFDVTTGVVSNMRSSLGLLTDHEYYGVEFSPDSNLLYVSEVGNIYNYTGRIYQIQYREPSPELTNYTVEYDGTYPMYALQLGIDDKIYAISDSLNLGVISSPNSLRKDCNYLYHAIQYSGSNNVNKKTLPQLVPEKLITVILPSFLKTFNTSFAKDTITSIKAVDNGVVVFGKTGADNTFNLPGPDDGFIAKFDQSGNLVDSDIQQIPFQIPLGIDDYFYRWDTLGNSYNLNGSLNKNYMANKYDSDGNLQFQINTTNIFEDFIEDRDTGNSYIVFPTSSDTDASITDASGQIWTKSATQKSNLTNTYYTKTLAVAKFDSSGTLLDVVELLDYKWYRDINGGTVPVEFPAKVYGDNTIYFTTSSREEGIYTDVAKITLTNGEIHKKGEWLVAYDIKNNVYKKIKLLSQNGSITPNDLIYMQSTLYTKRKNKLYKLDENLNEVDSLIDQKLDILEYDDIAGTFLIRGDSKNTLKKIDANLDEIWVKDLGRKFTLDHASEAPNGDIYISGSYTVDAKLLNPDAVELPLNAGTDAFIAKIYKTTETNGFAVVGKSNSNTISNINDGIESLNSALSIYPNPFENSIALKTGSNERVSVEIYNSAGMMIYKKQFENTGNQEIDLSSQRSGMYYVRLVDSKSNVINKKIIKL